MSEQYRDVDGNECSLDELCRREPAWAANRLRVAEARIRELEAALERAELALADWVNTYAPEFCDENDVRRAQSRIEQNGGTLAYIADVVQCVRDALTATPPPDSEPARELLAPGREHLTVSGTFQSDKHPTVPAGKVPLSVRDPIAQPFLYQYAQAHRAAGKHGDREFSRDLIDALFTAGYTPPDSEPAEGEGGLDVSREWAVCEATGRLAEQGMEEAVDDAADYGIGFQKGGQRIDPREVYKDPPQRRDALAQKALALCHKIEELPAGDLQTEIVTMAGDLFHALRWGNETPQRWDALGDANGLYQSLMVWLGGDSREAKSARETATDMYLRLRAALSAGVPEASERVRRALSRIIDTEYEKTEEGQREIEIVEHALSQSEQGRMPEDAQRTVDYLRDYLNEINKCEDGDRNERLEFHLEHAISIIAAAPQPQGKSDG